MHAADHIGLVCVFHVVEEANFKIRLHARVLQPRGTPDLKFGSDSLHELLVDLADLHVELVNICSFWIVVVNLLVGEIIVIEILVIA